MIFRFIKLIFLSLLSFERSFLQSFKCATFLNQPCSTKPTRIDLNPKELRYYSIYKCLYRCDGICKVLNNPSDKICFPNETEDVNIKVFNMTSGKNE